jgi:hypothetical protein
MCRLAADRSLAARMGREGQGRSAEQFRHEHATKQLRALYERVLAGPRAR